MRQHVFFVLALLTLTAVVNAHADDPVKCLTPHLIQHEREPDRVDPGTRQKIEELSRDVTSEERVYHSESGVFEIRYTTEGSDAVPDEDANQSGVPDYVEWAAEYADYSYQKQVQELGFVDPTVHQGQECGNRIGDWQDTTITIRFQDSYLYGYFETSNPFQINVHRNFFGFPPNTDPDGHVRGALKVTIAHELKHVIQYATNCFRGNAGNASWLEMDATMMENIVYPEVNDYYNYIGASHSVFKSPADRIPSPQVNASYSHVTWSLFYAEYLEERFWPQTWDAISRDHFIPMADAMKEPLIPSAHYNRDQTFAGNLARNHLWHASSGSRRISGYGFAEADAYPDAYMEQHHDTIPEPYLDSGELAPLSGTYRMFRPIKGQIGEISFSATHNHDQMAVGVLGYHRDHSEVEWVVPPESGGETMAVSPFALADVDSFIVVKVNADPEKTLSYSFEMNVESVPEVASLEQNYPNPFSAATGSPHTHIVFTVPDARRVTLTLYDILGRNIQVLFDGQVEAGRHEVPVDAGRLASGVYIYRLEAENVQETGKMTLIR